jgi:hypothetical protein
MRFKVPVEIEVEAKSPAEAHNRVHHALLSRDEITKFTIEGGLPREVIEAPWRPINTAPREDNKKILGYDAAIDHAETATWSEGSGKWIWNGNNEQPTHWKPHPEDKVGQS